MRDVFLQQKFSILCNRLAKTINRDDSDDIRDALNIIQDEKTIYHNHDWVIHNLKELEKVLIKKKKEIPSELKYREAAIYFEFNKDYIAAERLFLEILNNEKKDDWIKDRSRFYLIKIYLSQFSSLDNENVDISDNNFEKAENLLNVLQEKAYNRKLDAYVQGELWQLKSTIDMLQKDKKFSLMLYPENYSKKFGTKEEIESKVNDFNLFIDLSNNHVFINGQLKDFTDSDLTLLVLMSKGFSLNEYKKIVNIKSDDAFYQRIKRLKDILKELSLATFKKRYKFDPSVKIGIVYKSFESYDLFDFLY